MHAAFGLSDHLGCSLKSETAELVQQLAPFFSAEIGCRSVSRYSLHHGSIDFIVKAQLLLRTMDCGQLRTPAPLLRAVRADGPSGRHRELPPSLGQKDCRPCATAEKTAPCFWLVCKSHRPLTFRIAVGKSRERIHGRRENA